MLTVGSQAFNMGREARDFDLISRPEDLDKFKKEHESRIVLIKPTKFGETIFMTGSVPVEVDVSETGQELLEIVERNDLAYHTCDGKMVADPGVLLALKLSHRFLKNSPHFLKTMKDIHYLRSLGVTVPEVLTDWQKRRSLATYDYSHPKLNQGKSDFFSNDGVNYQFDHDSLHECVKIYDEPAFNKIKKDAAEVFCSKEKFYEVNQEVRLATGLEEALVLSLERFCIPNNFKTDPYKGFLISLEKISTSVTSGWFRTFVWEHYEEIKAMYLPDYVERFHKALAEGVIKPYKSS